MAYKSHIYAFLQEMFDPECLKDRRTPGEPESFSDKPHDKPHAQKARVKPPLQPGLNPLDHTPVLRLVGVLLWRWTSGDRPVDLYRSRNGLQDTSNSSSLRVQACIPVSRQAATDAYMALEHNANGFSMWYVWYLSLEVGESLLSQSSLGSSHERISLLRQSVMCQTTIPSIQRMPLSDSSLQTR